MPVARGWRVEEHLVDVLVARSKGLDSGHPLEQLRVERLFGLLKRVSVLFLILGLGGVDDIGGLQLLEAFPGLAEPRPAKAARVHARLAARCERVFGVATAAAVVFAVAVSFITVAHLAKHLLESVTESPRR